MAFGDNEETGWRWLAEEVLIRVLVLGLFALVVMVPLACFIDDCRWRLYDKHRTHPGSHA